VDSNGEHWLETEAWLRDELHIPGLRLAELRAQRSKLGMARLFEAAGIDHPPGARVDSAATLRQFAALHGFPLVLKPDTGSGAVDTFAIANQAELELALQRSLTSHIVQPYVPGDIITYDGLADRAGKIVFSTAHTYDVGIMQLRQGELDGHYYSLRELPHELEEVGRRAVAAFDIRERFFHVEFFARPSHGLVALEMNLRPPGGFTTDMMNAACDIDVYALWAAVLCGEPLNGFSFERKYFTAHAGRRRERRYRLDHDALVKELDGALVAHRAIPDPFAATMGNTAYLLRHRELSALQGAIALVQAR
jgi:biotin carboxylase